MKNLLKLLLALVFVLFSVPAFAALTCEMSVDGKIVEPMAQYSVPNIWFVNGVTKDGHPRKFRISLGVEGQMFTLQILDNDHVVQDSGFSRAAYLAGSKILNVAPNEVSLSWNDPQLNDPVVEVHCLLTP